MSVPAPSVDGMVPPTTTPSSGSRLWAAFWRHAGTVGAVVSVGFLGMGLAAFESGAHPDSGIVQAWVVLGMLGAIGCAISMVWRARAPEVVFLANAAAGLVLPIDPLGTLLALTWVLPRADRGRGAGAIAATAVVTAVSLRRDAMREGSNAVFTSKDAATGEVIQLTGWGYLILGVVLVLIAVGVGMLRRYRTSAVDARRAVEDESAIAAGLRVELNRQEERELIAREMHDTVAHHLSLVSLHASALEVTSWDPAVPESARAMRSSAHQALEEMRTLISSLRDSSDPGGAYTGQSPSLAKLETLIENARDAGAQITSDVTVIDGDSAPAALTRAVYRVVQEALTNAIKHAPGSGVRVMVQAAPGYGVQLLVSSWLVPASVPQYGTPAPVPAAGAASGSGAGLLGMRERAVAVGGRLTAGPDGGAWVVRGWLPWPNA